MMFLVDLFFPWPENNVFKLFLSVMIITHYYGILKFCMTKLCPVQNTCSVRHLFFGSYLVPLIKYSLIDKNLEYVSYLSYAFCLCLIAAFVTKYIEIPQTFLEWTHICILGISQSSVVEPRMKLVYSIVPCLCLMNFELNSVFLKYAIQSSCVGVVYFLMNSFDEDNILHLINIGYCICIIFFLQKINKNTKIKNKK